VTTRRTRPRGTRVLVVEDAPEIQYLLSVILATDDREVVLAGTASAAREELAKGDVALIVLDLILPDTDGRVLLGELRRSAHTAAVPIIVITSYTDPEVRAECYGLGADAYVEKPFDPDIFAADITDRLEHAATLRRDNGRDPLTGLANLARITGELEGLGRGDRAGVVVGVLDSMRDLLEGHGWAVGDMVVAQVAAALERAFAREGILLARLAADEFGLLLRDADLEVMRKQAGRLVDAVRRAAIPGLDGETFRLTASAGAVAIGDACPPSNAIDQARELAYRAQAAGGNRALGSADSVGDLGAGLVLVAEDDDITAKILSHRLEKEGFQVIRYPDGEKAYRGALEQTPAMVLLDVKMPGMDGFEVLQRLRKTPSYARVPIVLLTAMGGEADVVRGFQLGADDYILKPFSATELVARVLRLMRRGREPRGL
jgi:two-component system cell cycle response regulator